MRLFIILFLFITPGLFAQEIISTDEFKDYIGQEITVKGTIDQVVSLKDVRGKPTYFNMGGKYPDNKFTLLLWESNKHKFTKGAQFYEGKTIKVIGLIETYRGKPQIVIREPEQIEVLE